jgi:transcriptional regulator with PAS, ATPase and Fis domain
VIKLLIKKKLHQVRETQSSSNILPKTYNKQSIIKNNLTVSCDQIINKELHQVRETQSSSNILPKTYNKQSIIKNNLAVSCDQIINKELHQVRDNKPLTIFYLKLRMKRMS